jgi:hypothetical protein
MNRHRLTLIATAPERIMPRYLDRIARGAALAVLLAACSGTNASPSPSASSQPSQATPSATGSATELEALAAALKGTWTAAEITREEWISQEVALGNNIDDVENLLINNPMQSRIRYQLAFVGGRLTVSAAADGGPMVEQSGGPYRLLASGAIYYDDEGCYVTVKFTITEDRLAFQRISTVSCGADERVANSAFFNLVPYARTAGN